MLGTLKPIAIAVAKLGQAPASGTGTRQRWR